MQENPLSREECSAAKLLPGGKGGPGPRSGRRVLGEAPGAGGGAAQPRGGGERPV